MNPIARRYQFPNRLTDQMKFVIWDIRFTILLTGVTVREKQITEDKGIKENAIVKTRMFHCV